MSSPNFPQFVARSAASPDAFSRSPGEHYGSVSGASGGGSGQDSWISGNSSNISRLNTGPHLQLSSSHHHLLNSPPPVSRPSDPLGAVNGLHSYNDRDTYLARPSTHSNPVHNQPTPAPQSFTNNISSSPRTTLWWGELEPWMDEEYAKLVCSMMNWDPVNIKVPRPPPDPISPHHPNNPGYCFLTFPSQNQAASVLNQVNSSGNSLIMPNSTKPFVFNWASAVPPSPTASAFSLPTVIPSVSQAHVQQQPQQQFSKEYSIFVGDLAPEVSNSDLVAVFRNPVLGLRNDREPRLIRPFLSCKSAKIMLDPVTGVSRGYGFVRFTDEADQQRALIEMHGLYCLSRPMRISPATAKYKGQAPSSGTSIDYAGTFPVSGNVFPASDQQQESMSLALSIPNAQSQSISGPLASHSAGSNSSLHTTSGSTSSMPSLSSGPSSSSSTLASTVSEDVFKTQSSLGEAAQQQQGHNTAVSKPNVNSNVVNSITAAFAAQQVQGPLSSERYTISEESWKHHAQARAILSNLIGPNGEQLSSSDPYNTTVFVGGLSPLISEDTLRTFFAPFGDIHYVKVPAGKNCGFVQFIRKPDAERAIEKMQGFPIGGSRIRLSWGRSQYKAAQAAAQAAQTAALQSQFPPVPQQQLQTQIQHVQQQPQQRSPPPQLQAHVQSSPSQALPAITPEQALELVHKLGLVSYLTNPEPSSHVSNSSNHGFLPTSAGSSINYRDDEASVSALNMFPSAYRSSSGSSAVDEQIMRTQLSTNFSPFSPDPNLYTEGKNREPSGALRHESFHPSKSYAGVGDMQGGSSSSGKASPNATTSHAARSGGTDSPRYGQFFESSAPHLLARSSSRQEASAVIHRTSPPRKLSPGREIEFDGQDSIHDLNGTLASLDLDNSQGPGSWRQIAKSSSPSS